MEAGETQGAGRITTNGPLEVLSRRRDGTQLVEVIGAPITQAYELTIQVESSALAHVVFLTGELDGASAKTLESTLLDVEQDDVKRITIDLGGLSFIDSTGLAVLLRAVHRSRQDSNRVAFLRSRDEHVARLFRLTELDEELPFLDDRTVASDEPRKEGRT